MIIKKYEELAGFSEYWPAAPRADTVAPKSRPAKPRIVFVIHESFLKKKNSEIDYTPT